MQELEKIVRVANKGSGTVTEILLVLDATVGQNGLQQAKSFAKSVDLTGIILTKLDGSSKGGIIFAIAEELAIPIKLIGIGEGEEGNQGRGGGQEAAENRGNEKLLH